MILSAFVRFCMKIINTDVTTSAGVQLGCGAFVIPFIQEKYYCSTLVMWQRKETVLCEMFTHGPETWHRQHIELENSKGKYRKHCIFPYTKYSVRELQYLIPLFRSIWNWIKVMSMDGLLYSMSNIICSANNTTH